MASAAGRKALSWAIESLEIRRLLCSYAHQLVWIDPANPGSGAVNASLAHDDGDHDDGHDDHDHLQNNFDPNGTGNDTPPPASSSGSAATSAAAIAGSALPGLPTLNSFPSAHAAIYLDFNGDAGGQTAYDEDGNPGSFNAAEQQHISEAWRQI